MKFLELFLTFFKIGAFTFGGGYAMLPLIQEEVKNHGWMEAKQLIDFIAISESTPGPFAINVSTYVGTEVGGIFGAFCATLGVVLPSFIIILIVAKCYEKFKTNKYVIGCMSGLKPAVIGLIAAAFLSMINTVIIGSGIGSLSFFISVAIFAVMTVLVFIKIHPIIVICISAAAGIACGYIFSLPV